MGTVRDYAEEAANAGIEVVLSLAPSGDLWDPLREDLWRGRIEAVSAHGSFASRVVPYQKSICPDCHKRREPERDRGC